MANIEMTLDELQTKVVKSFKQLSTDPLKNIDNQSIYSFNYKHEFIFEMEELFKKIKHKGTSSLYVKMSKCKYCFEGTPAYSFYNSDTDVFVIRYVIYQESEKAFRVEECKNKKPLASTGDLPF